MANGGVCDRVAEIWATGDGEPPGSVRVLIESSIESRPLYLARCQHGWLWVKDRRHLLSIQVTPLSWRWAISADNGVITTVRRLTEDEMRFWLT
ncbi:hypothetical protein BS329_09180 [Amycolatopsis coloradensis]|uniref:Uncharacterized protein n=1 Tax=Amycolatopsis coloradensis TaxID=76021 RepID=A0A1R0KZA1_9PSEU|nr:hypothetical protein [Amycolatopsis coloradensis]OLZ54668.1 hypothetical protein BS329_09180 [Amycolatopsis coloradensis]